MQRTGKAAKRRLPFSLHIRCITSRLLKVTSPNRNNLLTRQKRNWLLDCVVAVRGFYGNSRHQLRFANRGRRLRCKFNSEPDRGQSAKCRNSLEDATYEPAGPGYGHLQPGKPAFG